MRASTLTMLSKICGLLNVPSFSFKKQLTVGCIWVCQAQFLNQMCTPSKSHFSALRNRPPFTQEARSKTRKDWCPLLFVYLPENPLKASKWVRSMYFVSQLLYFASLSVFLSNCRLKKKNSPCFPAPSLNCGRWLERQCAFALFCLLWQETQVSAPHSLQLLGLLRGRGGYFEIVYSKRQNSAIDFLDPPLLKLMKHTFKCTLKWCELSIPGRDSKTLGGDGYASLLGPPYPRRIYNPLLLNHHKMSASLISTTGLRKSLIDFFIQKFNNFWKVRGLLWQSSG